MTATMMSEDVYRLREASGLTQAEFADKLGLTRNGFQMIESDNAAMMPRYALAIESLSLELALQRQRPELVLPSMLLKLRQYRRMLEREGLL